jgi:hypothetical protein
MDRLFGTIDLHMHSTVSDGTDPPEALPAIAKSAGIGLFALTDHDDFKGCEIIRAHRSPEDPAFVTGIEFSCADGEGKYHILGYGFDPEAASIRQVVETGHGYRMNKVQIRLDFLKTRFGFHFAEEDVRALLALDNPGKPHIANLMIRYGYALSIDDAIKNYIDQLPLPDAHVLPEEAIGGIRGAGGIPVLAHPCYGSGDELILGEEMDARLHRLMDLGLQGVEAFYSGFTDKLCGMMLRFAAQYGLYVTAGSDYHGTNKMIAPGDTGLGGCGDWPEGLLRFLEAVNGNWLETALLRAGTSAKQTGIDHEI